MMMLVMVMVMAVMMIIIGRADQAAEEPQIVTICPDEHPFLLDKTTSDMMLSVTRTWLMMTTISNITFFEESRNDKSVFGIAQISS